LLLPPSAPTRYRSAIPALPRRFRTTPGWRRRKYTGDITATITIIIGGIAGTITIIAIITTIIVTGTAGECGSLERIPTGPFSAGLFSVQPLP
jgi:hypothetical protein